MNITGLSPEEIKAYATELKDTATAASLAHRLRKKKSVWKMN